MRILINYEKALRKLSLFCTLWLSNGFFKEKYKWCFERKNILKKLIHDLDFILDSALAKYNRSQANIDDFLDCLALAISAKLVFKSGNISKIIIAEQIDSKCFIMV